MTEVFTFNGTPLSEIKKKLPPVNEAIDSLNSDVFEVYGISDS